MTDFPLILESDATEKYHCTTQIVRSGGAPNGDGTEYRAAITIDERYTKQDGDLDAANICALSVERESVCHGE